MLLVYEGAEASGQRFHASRSITNDDLVDMLKFMDPDGDIEWIGFIV